MAILPTFLQADDLELKLRETREEIDKLRHDSSAITDRDAILLLADVLMFAVETKVFESREAVKKPSTKKDRKPLNEMMGSASTPQKG